MSSETPEMAATLETPSTGPSKHSIYGWMVCFLGAVFYLYEYLLRVAPSQMTHEIMDAFSINATAFGHLTAFYYYIYAPMQLVVGVLMDRYGPRRLLTMAVLCCTVGTALFADNHSLYVAEFGRFLVGFGSAFAFVGVLKLATIFLPSRVFGMVAGMTTALGMMGGMLGDLSVEKLLNHMDWKQTLYYFAIAGVILNVVVFFVLRDTASSKVKYKPSVPTMSQGLNGLLGLLMTRAIWLNGLVGCLIFLPVSTFVELWGPAYMEAAYQMDKEKAAWAMSWIFMGWATGGPIMGYVSDRIRQRRLPMTIGAAVAAVIFSAVLFFPNFPEQYIYPAFFVFGFFSSSQVLVFAMGRELTSAKYSGTVMALTNMFVMMGGAVTIRLVGRLLDSHWSGEVLNGVHVYSGANFQYALAILPIGLVLAVVVSLFLPETNAKMRPSADS